MFPSIYNAHPVTREYIGTGFADPDPMLRDAATGAALSDDLVAAAGWLLPAFAYLDAPPAVPAKHVARRLADGSAWELVEDHRGTVYTTADQTEHDYEDLGPLPAEVTDIAPTSPYQVWSQGQWVADPTAQLAAQKLAARQVRDQAITDSQWLVDRHRDQVDAAVATTLTAAQFTELLVYRQALRDWPTAADFPSLPDLPAAPAWLAAAEAADDAVTAP